MLKNYLKYLPGDLKSRARYKLIILLFIVALAVMLFLLLGYQSGYAQGVAYSNNYYAETMAKCIFLP